MKMDSNRVMALLDIYRGTFKPEHHTGAIQSDLLFLEENGLIKDKATGPEVTDGGREIIKSILDVACYQFYAVTER